MRTPQDIPRVQSDFFNMAHFSRVIGCVDGTHIKIQSPGGEDAEVFRNRKSFFSINTQVVFDTDLKILDIVARWPGSAHDLTIFNRSRIRARFEGREFPNGVLVADSGYIDRAYLMLPVQNPVTPEQRYISQIRTRNTIESQIGVWKRRFPILAYGGRCNLDTTLTVIVATAVLNNVAINANEAMPPDPENIGADELDYLIAMGDIPDVPHRNRRAQANRPAINYRNLLIQKII